MKLKVGDKLHAIRSKREMSQDDFAELLGLSKSAYGRLEKKETSIELERLIQIADKLNVPLTEVLPDTLSLTNNSSGQGAINFGTITTYNIYAVEEGMKSLMEENEQLKETISSLQRQLGR